MTRFYQAMADGQVILTLRGETRVEQITLDSATIATAWGTRVGMPFSALYASAYEGECQRVPASEGSRCSVRRRRVSVSAIGSMASGTARRA